MVETTYSNSLFKLKGKKTIEWQWCEKKQTNWKKEILMGLSFYGFHFHPRHSIQFFRLAKKFPK